MIQRILMAGAFVLMGTVAAQASCPALPSGLGVTAASPSGGLSGSIPGVLSAGAISFCLNAAGLVNLSIADVGFESLPTGFPSIFEIYIDDPTRATNLAPAKEVQYDEFDSTGFYSFLIQSIPLTSGNHSLVIIDDVVAAAGSSYSYGGANRPTLTIEDTSQLVTDDLKVSLQLQNVTTPEPATMAIFAVGLAGLGAARRRKAA